MKQCITPEAAFNILCDAFKDILDNSTHRSFSYRENLSFYIGKHVSKDYVTSRLEEFSADYNIANGFIEVDPGDEISFRIIWKI